MKQVLASNAPVDGAVFKFEDPTSTPYTITIHASAYSNLPNQMLRLVVKLDYDYVAELHLFSNGAAEHRALIPASFQVTPGSSQIKHAIALSAADNTVIDVYDRVTIVIDY